MRFSALTFFHGNLHGDGAGRGPLGVVLLPDRSAEQDEDSVADELVDGALVLLDDGHHGGQIAIEQLHDAVGRQALRQRGEAAEIGHHHCELPLLATHLQSARRFEHGVDHLVGEIAPEGLPDKAVAQLHLLGEALQLGLDPLAVRHVGPRADDLPRLAGVIVRDGESVLDPNIMPVAMAETIFETAAALADQPLELGEYADWHPPGGGA